MLLLSGSGPWDKTLTATRALTWTSHCDWQTFHPTSKMNPVMTHQEQLSQWHHPPRTPDIAAVKIKPPMMTVSIQSTYSALRKQEKCWFLWVNIMTGGSPNTSEPSYCQQWHPSNFNDWLISTHWTSGPKVTLTSPSCLESLQHRSTIELWNIYNNETRFTTSNLKMFHGNAGNELG